MREITSPNGDSTDNTEAVPSEFGGRLDQDGLVSDEARSAIGPGKARQQPIHVAVFTPDLGSGGCERMSLFITQSLAAAGMRVDLIVSQNEGPLVDHPVAIAHRVDLKATGQWSVGALLRYYRRARPQLVLAIGRTAKIVAGLANQYEPSLPFIVSVRGVLERPKYSRFWLRALFGHAPERWLYRRAVAAQATLPSMGKQVERAFGISSERVAMIHNPITIDRPVSAFPSHHAEWFDRPVIVTAGRLESQKDQAALLRAFALSGLKDRARLLILGVGPLEDRLRRQAETLKLGGAVVLGGFASDIRPYFERAQGFVLSSSHESFGLVILEALACGIPVASYACPTGPEELLDHGRLGRLVSPGDEAAMAQAMRDMVDGSLPAPDPDALAAHLARFDPRKIADQWVAFVERCVEEAAGLQAAEAA